MERLIDLHTHTIYSDGNKSPKQLLNMAKEIGITDFAITDHDTINGVKTIKKEDIEELNFITGVELTAKATKGRMHILGYNIDVYNDNLNAKLNNRNDLYNFMLYVNGLKELFNISFEDSEITEITTRVGNIGRPDLARLLLKHNYVKSIQEAFDKYLNPVMDNCRSQKRGYTKEECIEMIIDAGGIPVLAHPITLKMTKEELIQELKYLKSIGLMGVETKHIHHNPEYTEMLEEIALDLDLLTTGGTDYHGEIKPDVKLGTGINNNVKVTSSTMIDYLINLNKPKTKCIRKNNTNNETI